MTTAQPRWTTTDQLRDAAFGLHITDDDETNRQLNKLLIRAENLLIATIPQLLERIETGRLNQNTVAGVTENMVLRVIRNPEGVQSDSTAGVSTAFFRGSASGVLEVLKEDRNALNPPTRHVGTITIGVPSWRYP